MSGTCPDCGERLSGRGPKALVQAILEHGIAHELLDGLEAELAGR